MVDEEFLFGAQRPLGDNPFSRLKQRDPVELAVFHIRVAGRIRGQKRRPPKGCFACLTADAVSVIQRAKRSIYQETVAIR